MPHSSVMNFVDPDQFQRAVQPADARIVITGRGRFDAKLTLIKFDSLWMQHGHFSLPAVVHSRIPWQTEGCSSFSSTLIGDSPILHSGTEVAPDEIVCYPRAP